MHDAGAASRMSRSGVRAVALTISLLAGLSSGVRAQDDIDKAHAEAGQLWYDRYCTPCHGAGGAPGSAVYRETKKPVDLRDYVARHDGKFPASQWLAVVATDNPALLHTAVWEKIVDSQSGLTRPDAAARGIVASIANYVASVQSKK